MSLIDVIENELKRCYDFYHEDGDWTGDQLFSLVKPLHEALLILARTTESATKTELVGELHNDVRV